MKTDRYTRVILTIIAINLSFISLKNLDIIPKAVAAPSPEFGYKSSNVSYGLIPLNKDGSVDVTLKAIAPNTTMDVNIDKVGGFSTFGEVPVEIKDQPIEVEVKN